MSKSSAINDRFRFAVDTARSTASIALTHFQSTRLTVENKPDGSFVTEADRAVETDLRRRIRDSFPGDGIVGEEFGETAGASNYRWVLDPIDGTTSFVHGVPLWGMLIAVEENDEPVIGVIHMPALNEIVFAAQELGSWHCVGDRDPVATGVSSSKRLSDSLLCVTALDYFTKTDSTGAFHDLAARFGATRGWSDCYAHLLVATGRVDAVVEPMINAWDVAPMIPIMHEAGGRFTDWRGRQTAYGQTAVASNGHIHDQVLALLADR